MKTCVYVLQLEEEKFYVGITTRGVQRLEEHLRHFGKIKGAMWTRFYRPIDVVEIIVDCDSVVEKLKTLEYMIKYGWQNVRGSTWTAFKLPNMPTELKIYYGIVDDWSI